MLPTCCWRRLCPRRAAGWQRNSSCTRCAGSPVAALTSELSRGCSSSARPTTVDTGWAAAEGCPYPHRRGECAGSNGHADHGLLRRGGLWEQDVSGGSRVLAGLASRLSQAESNALHRQSRPIRSGQRGSKTSTTVRNSLDTPRSSRPTCPACGSHVRGHLKLADTADSRTPPIGSRLWCRSAGATPVASAKTGARCRRPRPPPRFADLPEITEQMSPAPDRCVMRAGGGACRAGWRSRPSKGHPLRVAALALYVQAAAPRRRGRDHHRRRSLPAVASWPVSPGEGCGACCTVVTPSRPSSEQFVRPLTSGPQRA